MYRSQEWWRARAEEKAIPACQARGGKYVAGSADFGPGHSRNPGSGAEFNGNNLGWFYAYQTHAHRYGGNNHGQVVGKARESRTWVGVCTKRVRRR